MPTVSVPQNWAGSEVTSWRTKGLCPRSAASNSPAHLDRDYPLKSRSNSLATVGAMSELAPTPPAEPQAGCMNTIGVKQDDGSFLLASGKAFVVRRRCRCSSASCSHTSAHARTTPAYMCMSRPLKQAPATHACDRCLRRARRARVELLSTSTRLSCGACRQSAPRRRRLSCACTRARASTSACCFSTGARA